MLWEETELGRGIGSCHFKHVATGTSPGMPRMTQIFCCTFSIRIEISCSLFNPMKMMFIILHSVLFMRTHGGTFPLVLELAVVGFLLGNWFLFIFWAARIMEQIMFPSLFRLQGNLKLWHELRALILFLPLSFFFYLILVFVPTDSLTYFKFYFVIFILLHLLKNFVRFIYLLYRENECMRARGRAEAEGERIFQQIPH